MNTTKETRVLLRRMGETDPESIEDYIKTEGYEALKKVLKSMKPREVIEEVKQSGLRGRGGAGFSTGAKWAFSASIEGERYVVCNADEGEPGTFKDRLIMENDPHRLVEAMIICGYAIQAKKGIIYIRGEYPNSVKILNKAIKQAEEKGLLGENILKSGFSYHLEVFRGAGAYLCGEETALIESIEGNRGHPRIKPPFPSVKGLKNSPTVVNNVETLGSIPDIILRGSEWFKKIGMPSCTGTKIYTISGRVNKQGFYELPMGATLRTLIFDLCEGIRDKGKFLAAQVGGSTGGILSEDMLDVPLDFDSLSQRNLMLGSGSVLVIDETVDIREFFHYLTNFYKNESCGKCAPCRLGTMYFFKKAEEIVRNKKISRQEWDKMVNLSIHMKDASYCPLGQSLYNPVSTLNRFFINELVSDF
ncbi:MAG: NADH-quinone oxidoreductase subunit NuoF [bacterium]|nr:NADH-quinone oxidoreductase subunit NuoF [bacterium]